MKVIETSESTFDKVVELTGAECDEYEHNTYVIVGDSRSYTKIIPNSCF